MRIVKLAVDAGEAHGRLDRLVTRRLRSFSRGEVQSLIKDGYVKWEGEALLKPSGHIPGPGTLEVVLPFGEGEDPLVLEANRILYRDAFVIAVDKPAGYPTRGRLALGNNDVCEAVKRSMGNEDAYLGMPHRLDRETSGVLIFGLDKASTARLQRSFARGEAHKAYVAWVGGRLERRTGLIDAPIHAPGRELPKVDEAGKPAVTWYRVMEERGEMSLLLAHPETGRTHQLRVHFAHIGHSIVGDAVYGVSNAPRCMLHALKLVIPHPHTGQKLVLKAPIPQGFLRESVLA